MHRAGPLLARTEHTPAGAVLRWRLPRNCALTPRQVLQAYLGLCAWKAAVAAGFWLIGYPLVAVFSALCLVGMAAALLSYARHAGDHDTVTLTLPHGHLAVEQRCGAALRRTELQAAWVRMDGAPGALVGLSERGVRVQVGRHALPQQRAQLARELRQALRAAQATA